MQHQSATRFNGLRASYVVRLPDLPSSRTARNSQPGFHKGMIAEQIKDRWQFGQSKISFLFASALGEELLWEETADCQEVRHSDTFRMARIIFPLFGTLLQQAKHVP
jgi:hypothetical protein